jgi:predicted Zn-dependent protease
MTARAAPAVTGYRCDVGCRLIARLDNPRFSYRVFVVRDPNVNVFAVPGGYVDPHTGRLLGVTSEAELTGVLAHERVLLQRTKNRTISKTIRRMIVSSSSSARAVAARPARTSAIFWTSSSLPSMLRCHSPKCRRSAVRA